jgi:hypothetical protein
MHDHEGGSEFDSRPLRDMTYYRIRVVCKFCQHIAHLRPMDLAKRQPPRRNWKLIQGRLRCTMCGKKQAEAIAEKLPRD